MSQRIVRLRWWLARLFLNWALDLVEPYLTDAGAKSASALAKEFPK